MPRKRGELVETSLICEKTGWRGGAEFKQVGSSTKAWNVCGYLMIQKTGTNLKRVERWGYPRASVYRCGKRALEELIAAGAPGVNIYLTKKRHETSG